MYFAEAKMFDGKPMPMTMMTLPFLNRKRDWHTQPVLLPAEEESWTLKQLQQKYGGIDEPDVAAPVEAYLSDEQVAYLVKYLRKNVEHAELTLSQLPEVVPARHAEDVAKIKNLVTNLTGILDVFNDAMGVAHEED